MVKFFKFRIKCFPTEHPYQRHIIELNKIKALPSMLVFAIARNFLMHRRDEVYSGPCELNYQHVFKSQNMVSHNTQESYIITRPNS